MDLATALAPEPAVKWIIGRVTAVTGGTLTMTYRGGVVTNVGIAVPYVPKVGDVVHVLSSDANGMIAVGASNGTVTPPVTPPPAIPVTVAPLSTSVYQVSTGTWSAPTGAVPYSGQASAAINATVVASGTVPAAGIVSRAVTVTVTASGVAQAPITGAVSRAITVTIAASGTAGLPVAALFPDTGAFPDTGRKLRI